MPFRKLKAIASVVALVGTLVPASAFAATPFSDTISDVALRSGGMLLGQVVDHQGVAKPDTLVSIEFAGNEVVSTTTDANGVFAARGLRGGQYQLVTPQGGIACRLWTADTAPPSARPAALVVSGKEVVRGQGPGCGDACGPENYYERKNGLVGWMKTHPYIVGGTVATAIAIPLALADDDSDSGS
jgi:hypothetical protein